MIVLANPLKPKDMRYVTPGIWEVSRTYTVKELTPAANGLDHIIAAIAEVGIDFGDNYGAREGSEPTNGLTCTEIIPIELSDIQDAIDIKYVYKQIGVQASGGPEVQILDCTVSGSMRTFETPFEEEGEFDIFQLPPPMPGEDKTIKVYHPTEVDANGDPLSQPAIIQSHFPVVEIIVQTKEYQDPIEKALKYVSTVNSLPFQISLPASLGTNNLPRTIVYEEEQLMCESISGSFQKDGFWLVDYALIAREAVIRTEADGHMEYWYWKEPAWYKDDRTQLLVEGAQLGNGAIKMVSPYKQEDWSQMFY